MVARTAAKVSFILLSACVLVTAFIVLGEVTVRWLRPARVTARLKLEMLAANPPRLYPAARREPLRPVLAEPPRPVAGGPKAAALDAGRAFDAVKDPKPAKPTPLPEPLAYADPADGAAAHGRPDPAASEAPHPEAQDSKAATPVAPKPAAPQQQASADPNAVALPVFPGRQALATGEAPPALSLPPLLNGNPLLQPDPVPAAGAAPPQDSAAPAVDADPAPDPSDVVGSIEADGPGHTTFKASLGEPFRARSRGQSLRIVQIGDSHTAADMFTGEVRQRLQTAFGDGGAGYLDVGKPHPGVRSEVLRMNVSPGWTYTAIQRSEDASQFRLSGFNAIAAKAGETMTLSTGKPIRFDSIDIAVRHGPDAGAIELRFDNDDAVRFDLKGPKAEWWFLRATSQRHHVEELKQLTITTLDARPVDISSVAILNQTYGVSYSAIGFPGATVDIVNKFSANFFTADLQRINPQIVVLAFGTNEGFDDALNIPSYGERYQNAISRIRAAVPNAEIVLVGPANSNRLPHACRGETGPLVCRPPQAGLAPLQGCFWQTPPKLDRVREMQKLIADHDHLHFWNWSEIQAPDCGAHQWATASPRLMQPDHVHFTADGYRIGADRFADFLMPIVEKLRRTSRVVSNN